MAGLKTPYTGEGYAPAYQLSAVPYVTSSIVGLGEIQQIKFGNVTRFFEVRSTGDAASAIAVAFTERGLLTANSNFIVLSGSEAFSGEIRTDRLFISGTALTGSYTLVAGLTPIKTRDFTVLTASNGYLGVG